MIRPGFCRSGHICFRKQQVFPRNRYRRRPYHRKMKNPVLPDVSDHKKIKGMHIASGCKTGGDMKLFRKVTGIALAAAMILSLAACGEQAASTSASSTKAASTKTESTKAESTKAESTKAESTKAESTKAESTTAASSTKAESTAAASSSTSEPAGTGDIYSGDKLRLQYVCISFGNVWMQQIRDALQELASQYNVEILTSDADWNIETQLSQIDTAITDKINGAWLFICDEASATACVDKFDEAGIPVIGETLKLQDADGNWVAPCVELDAFGVGETAGQWVVDNYKDYLPLDDDWSKVGVFVMTEFTRQSDVNRGNGFVGPLKEQLPIPEENYIFGDASTGSSDDDTQNSYDVSNATLSAHPEIDYWVCFGTVDAYALGTCRAIEAQGMEDVCMLSSCGGEYAVVEWANGEAPVWVSICYYEAMDFAKVMMDGMLEILRGGKDATEIFAEYKDPGQKYGAVGIKGNMRLREEFLP